MVLLMLPLTVVLLNLHFAVPTALSLALCTLLKDSGIADEKWDKTAKKNRFVSSEKHFCFNGFINSGNSESRQRTRMGR